jgi:hypothetical protein
VFARSGMVHSSPARSPASKLTIALMQTPLHNRQGWAHPLKADLRHRRQPCTVRLLPPPPVSFEYCPPRLRSFPSAANCHASNGPVQSACAKKGDSEEALRIRWSSRSSKPAVVRRGNGVFDSHALPPSLPCTTRRLRLPVTDVNIRLLVVPGSVERALRG